MRIGTDIDNVEMVTTDDGGRIPAQYQEFVEVFSKKKAETLPPHRQIDHAIDLEPDYKLPYGRIYNLSEFELKTLKPTSKRTWRTASFNGHHPRPQRRSCLQRKKTEDYGCVSTIELST
jgi:hypothetical protein